MLNCIADEGMRINPPVSLGHRREVSVDTLIGGHQVPAGVNELLADIL